LHVPRSIYLDPIGFTCENGCLTATGKLKRFNLKQRYESQIHAMYQELDHNTLNIDGQHPQQGQQDTTEVDGDEVPEVAAIKAKLRRILRDVVGVAMGEGSCGEEGSNLFLERGGDSLSGVMLCQAIEEEFGVEIAASSLLSQKLTLTSLALCIYHKLDNNNHNNDESSVAPVEYVCFEDELHALHQAMEESRQEIDSPDKGETSNDIFLTGNFFPSFTSDMLWHLVPVEFLC